MGYNVYDYESTERMFSDAYILEQTDIVIVSNNSESECLDFNKRIKSIKHNLPIVFISRVFSKDTLTALTKSGAVNFILKPINYDEFTERIRNLLPSKMVSISVNELINSEVARATRGKYSVSVLTVSINEENQAEGEMNNNLLGMLTKLKEDCVHIYRSVDTVFEFGNQLMIILPFTNKEGTPVVIQKLLNHIKDNVDRFPYKLKLGAATFPEECRDAGSFLELAQSRMLRYNESKPEMIKPNKNAEKLKSASFVQSTNELNLRSIQESGGVKLVWDTVKGAAKYEVNRYSNGNLEESKFVYINRYTDNFVKLATPYTFQVRALTKTAQTIIEEHTMVFVKK